MSGIEILTNPNNRVQVNVAHPDDEGYGNGMLLLANPNNKYVRYGSRGEASTKGDRYFVKSGGRAYEADRALEFMGVPLSQRRFLNGYQDGRLQNSVFHISRELMRDIVEQEITDVVTFNRYGMDGHKDHRAMNAASRLAVGTLLQKGHPVPVRLWTLNLETEQPDAEFPVCENDRVDIVLNYGSQFPDRRSVLDASLDHSSYFALLHKETYSLEFDPETSSERVLGNLALI